MSFSIKNVLTDVKLFLLLWFLLRAHVLLVLFFSFFSLFFFSLALSLPAALRCQCTLHCSLLYTGSWQCQPSSWLPQISSTLMISCTVSCMNCTLLLGSQRPLIYCTSKTQHIVSKPTPPPIIHFWLMASPSTQKSVLCLTSHHMSLVSKYWGFFPLILLIQLY